MRILSILLLSSVIGTGILSGSAAFAHKKKSSHVHCQVDGKGVKAHGSTHEEQKKSCDAIPGATWDESHAYQVGKHGVAITDEVRRPAEAKKKK